jgi:malonyl CoA-acyl carrier protein transacylase
MLFHKIGKVATGTLKKSRAIMIFVSLAVHCVVNATVTYAQAALTQIVERTCKWVNQVERMRKECVESACSTLPMLVPIRGPCTATASGKEVCL